MSFRTLVVFDRARRQTKVVSVVFVDEAGASKLRLAGTLRRRGAARLSASRKYCWRRHRLLRRRSWPQPYQLATPRRHRFPPTGPKRIFAAVSEVKEHILAGDCYQAVISQRFARHVTAGPVSIYRALRRTNPAPYTYLLKLGSEAIIGASPEMLVRCRGRRLITGP